MVAFRKEFRCAEPRFLCHFNRSRSLGLSIPLSLAGTDGDGHALLVDVADLEVRELGDAQSGGIEGHQHDAMLDVGG